MALLQTYPQLRTEADKLLRNQMEIIRRYSSRLDFSRANREYSFKVDEIADIEQNTDLFYFEYKRLRIACRTRFDISSATYNDITIRSRLATGSPTEIDKINAGWGDYMLYCWGTHDNIDEFIIIDLVEFRENQEYFIKIRDKWNDDGRSAFNSYDLRKILKTPCNIVAHLKDVS